jgi:hypothetical protein
VARYLADTSFDHDYRVIAGFTGQSVELEESTGPGHAAGSQARG